ncbi:MAG: thiamine phosphate synthase [Pseudomonadota bacterium]
MNSLGISLYGILDPARTRGRDLDEMASAAARGGVTLLQYRDKTADTRTMVSAGREIAKALEPHSVPLLINDRVDVALAVGAQGVHLGQSDMHPGDARRLLGDDAIIGLTIKTVEHAEQAPLELLDYVCIGGVFTTMSKDNPTNIGLDGWRRLADVFAARNARLPIGAIAGIDASNLASVLKNGADGAAIISAIFMADDVEQAARELKAIVEQVKP